MGKENKTVCITPPQCPLTAFIVYILRSQNDNDPSTIPHVPISFLYPYFLLAISILNCPVTYY